MKVIGLVSAICITILIAVSYSYCDILELKDGTVMLNCYVKDEGNHFIVWESLDKVGTPEYKIVLYSQLAPRLSKRYTKVVDGKTVQLPDHNPLKERGADWDAKPQLPDLSVTFIEMNPKLAGLHGNVQYTKYNTPYVGGAPMLKKRIEEIGEERKFLEPEYIAQDLKLEYKEGEEITFTAHVKNFGFVDSKPFKFRWLVDDKEVATGSYDKAIKELGEATFEYKYKWTDPKHTIGFEIITDQKEIATINNKATDAMWAFSYFYVVNPKRAASWHEFRSAYGTFSWEDFYRWHVDIMNILFQNSVYPSAPQGILARVRLDRIIYLDGVTSKTASEAITAKDGIGYHQGGWIWTDSDKEIQTGEFGQTDHTWRNQTEWSLPHELGHQLGLVDYYAIDYDGSDDHKWQDNGEKIRHFQNHPAVMMHWHGPHLWNEIDAMYLNMTWNKPRGHFGDHYFAIPDENFLQILDINGKAVPDAKVECFQRGTEVDPQGKPEVQEGVTWYPVIEDEDFGKPCSKLPVIVGNTDQYGMIRLPNRPAFEVKTLNGFHRKANPWGNINVVGGRGLMLVKVTKDGKVAYFYLEAIDFNLAWYKGQKEKFVVNLQTPFKSPDSPNPPQNVQWRYTDETKKKVRITWQMAPMRERHPQQIPVAYRVYRRMGDMALNDRPWYPLGTVNPDPQTRQNTFEMEIDLEETKVQDVEWFTRTERFGVTTVAALGVQSELAQAADTNPKPPQQ